MTIITDPRYTVLMGMWSGLKTARRTYEKHKLKGPTKVEEELKKLIDKVEDQLKAMEGGA